MKYSRKKSKIKDHPKSKIAQKTVKKNAKNSFKSYKSSRNSEDVAAGRLNIKYVKQTNPYNCGPIAIYNLLQWSLKNNNNLESYPKKWSLRKISQICQCNPSRGTLSDHFTNALQQILPGTGINLSKIQIYPSLEQIKQHLNNGGVIILEYHWSDNSQTRWEKPEDEMINWQKYSEEGKADEHYVLLTENGPKGLHVINSGPKQGVIEFFSNRQIRELLWPFNYKLGTKYDKEYNLSYPKAWFFYKNSPQTNKGKIHIELDSNSIND